MRIRQLHYFYALGKYLNYKLAADGLFITQSVLSQQIADLESELGIALFQRDKKSLALTPAGEELMWNLPDLFKLMDQTFTLIHSKNDKTVTESILRIGFEKPVPDGDVSGLVRSFQLMEPGIKCMVTQYSFRQLADAVGDGRIDIGFFLMPSSGLPRNLSFQLIAQDSLALIFRRELLTSSPESIRNAITGKKIFCFEKAAGGTPQVFRMCHALNIVPELYFCEEIDEILCNVESGFGVSILPKRYAEHSGFSGKLMVLDLAGFDGGSLCTAAAYDPEKCVSAALRFLSQLPQCAPDCTACVNTACHLHPQQR